MAKKKLPAKPVKEVRIKDPKKVAAGKARAASAIKDSGGRYVPKILVNEVTKILLATKGQDVSKIAADQTKKITALMADAKVSAKEVAAFYKQNKEIFEDVINNGELTGTPRNSNQLTKSLEDYKGVIEVNGKQTTAAKAKYKLMQFKQYLSANINVVDFTIQPQLSFDGKMKLEIPNPQRLVKDLLQYFGAKNVDELEDFSGAEITEAIREILGEDSPIIIYAS